MVKKQSPKLLVPVEVVERHIYVIRGHKVMIDSDLADLYEVTTSNLNKAVKRNIDRFPEDFMFRLTDEEAQSLTFQSGISKTGGRGGRRYLPYAFTQEGVAMLSSVLNSDRAVQVNISIMRAFVKLREIILSNTELTKKLELMEKKTDARFKVVFDAIRKLMQPQIKTRSRIGFRTDDKKK